MRHGIARTGQRPRVERNRSPCPLAHGRYTGAEGFFRRVIVAQEADPKCDPTNMYKLRSMTSTGCCGDKATRSKQPGEAERLFRRVLVGRKAAFGPDHPTALFYAR